MLTNLFETRQSMKNPWKRAFLGLLILDGLIVVLLIGLYLSFYFNQPKATLPENIAVPHLTGAPIFKVSGNKAQLAAMMNQELQKKLTGNLDAGVALNDYVSILGNLKILGIQIPFNMIFQPKVMNDGEAVVLNEKSVTLGEFSLPDTEVLGFIQAGAHFPKWIVVQPDKKQIVLHLSGFVIKDKYIVRANQIDLPHNKLVFNIYHSNGK
jgi:uncharacterized protein YpmS